MRYMTENRLAQLAVELFDSYIGMQRRGVRCLNTYGNEYVRIIKKICPEKHLYEVTACNISEHLTKHKNPEETIIAVLKNIKED